MREKVVDHITQLSDKPFARAYSVSAYFRESPNIWNATHYEWTTTPPTDPGWYWAKNKYERVSIVRLDFIHGPVVWSVGEDGYNLPEQFTHWIGPLPIPEPPT